MVKLAYQYEIEEVSLLLLRMVFALPFYLGVWVWKRKKWNQKPLKGKDYGVLLFLGIIGYYLASYFDFKGLTYITASLERLILFTYPTMVLVLSAIFLKKRISGAQILAIIVTYFGLAVIFFDSEGIAAGSTAEVLTGSAFIMLSALTYAMYLTGTNFLVAKTGSLRLTVLVMTISCISVILHFLLTKQPDILGYQKEVYILGVLMAVFATVLPSFLINEAIKQIGAPDVSIIGSLGPVSTIVLSMIFLGEQLTLTQYAGALVIISGVVIIGHSKR